MSQGKHWKQVAIEKSGLLSDLWDVFISYGGRAAGWILFGCMLCNIIQVIPGVTVPQYIISITMGVQIVTLDIAGFGLNTIAKQVMKHSKDEEFRETARSAKRLARFLIGLMILTVALITIGVLYPPAKTATDIIDKVLILARIVLIVIYMHTMHDLRQVELEVQTLEKQTAEANDQLLLDMAERMKALTTRMDTLSTAQQKALQSADVERMIRAFNGPFIQQIEGLHSDLHSGLQLMVTGEEIEQKMKGFTASFSDQIESLQSDLYSTLQSALQWYSEDQIETFISTLLDARMQAVNETLTTMKKTVSVTMEQSSTQRSRTSGTRAVKSAKPALAQLPAPKSKADFDRKAFVYECLKLDSGMSIAAIKAKALQEHNAKISEGSASKYRSLFFSEFEGVSFSRNEGQNETLNEGQNETLNEGQNETLNEGQNETLNEGQNETLNEGDYEDENETPNEAHTDPELVAINE